MLADRLPRELLDIILGLLNIEDLASLSSTCNALHGPTNSFLYGYGLPLNTSTSELKVRIQESLRLNPSNAQYLRRFTSTSFEIFELIAPELGQIEELSLEWTDVKDLEARLPDLRTKFQSNASIRHIFCQEPSSSRITEWAVLFSQMSIFPGLRQLSVEGNLYDRPSQFLAVIESAQIEELSLLNFHKHCMFLSPTQMPNLRLLHYHWFDPEISPFFEREIDLTHPFLEEEKPRIVQNFWRSFKDLKKRDINLCITMWQDDAFHERTLWFAELIRQDGSTAEDSDLEWLIRGSKYAHTHKFNETMVTIDLKGMEASLRDRILKLASRMKSLSTTPCAFRISVYASDTNGFYLSDTVHHHSSLLQSIPSSTTEIFISVEQSINTKFLHALIRSLSDLEYIILSTACRPKASRSLAADETNGAEDNPIEGLKESKVWCTRYGYLVRACSVYGAYAIELELNRNGSWTWWASKDINLDRVQRFEKALSDEADRLNVNFINELTGWFNFNSSLRRIRWRIWDGEQAAFPRNRWYY
jgi:hypothetical protein